MRNEPENPINLLLSRTSDESYLLQWETTLQKKPQPISHTQEHSVIIFGMQQESFALSTQYFVEISEMKKIHQLPSRDPYFLRGIVNLKGQLRLCIALDHLLEIERPVVIEDSYKRLIAICRGKDFWTFAADEVFGIYRFSEKDIQDIPATLSKTKANFLQGIISWKNQDVGYLKSDILFESLKKYI